MFFYVIISIVGDKMKNSIKILISCIITAIVVSSVSIYATIMMKANEIEFNPTDPS